MKKSELRRIIKEEIKKLHIKEQSPVGPSTPCSPDCQAGFNCKQWISSIIQLPNFSSTNPNQPCNFIENKIDQLQTWIANFTGNPNSQQLLQKTCKLQALQYICNNPSFAGGTYSCSNC